VTNESGDPICVLRAEYPSWRFGRVWATAASGPDRCRVTAYRDGVLLSAWNVPELAEKLRHEDNHAHRGTGPRAN
jgi:hypothetical protein